MKNNNHFISKLLEIIKLVPDGINLLSKNGEYARVVLPDGQLLITISPSGIEIPGISISDNFFTKTSPLPDDFVPMSQVIELLEFLTKHNLFQRLNHLGLCYSVESVKLERERLINEVKKTNLHLYEENSNDDSAWLFLGDRKYWPSPLVELVLNEKTEDKWKNYWLPHFQIDIDTHLNGDEIEKLILNTFKGKVKPYRILENEKFIILVRARLGIVSGININLDLGFEGRMALYHRQNILKQLV
ncbi:MAG: hypothetical protein Q8N84_00775 [bacterium]|nr:hypothetical protein [bacterium]